MNLRIPKDGVVLMSEGRMGHFGAGIRFRGDALINMH